MVAQLPVSAPVTTASTNATPLRTRMSGAARVCTRVRQSGAGSHARGSRGSEMRLLDHIARSTAPHLVCLPRVFSPCDFAQQVADCPLRYVLSDRLVRMCIELACSQGDELSGCLDLVRLPASRHIWIEWNDLTWQPDGWARVAVGRVARRVLVRGALVSVGANRRSASVRTFLLPKGMSPTPVVVPMTTLLELGNGNAASPPDLVHAPTDEVLEASLPQGVRRVLDHARFRLDPNCADHYRSLSRSPKILEQLTQADLGQVALDVPILIALFLLLSLRANLPCMPVNVRTRPQNSRPSGFIELSAPLFLAAPRLADSAMPECRSLAFDHVPGDIQRRKDIVFWRRNNWSAHVRLGQGSKNCTPVVWSAAPSDTPQRSTLSLVRAFCDRFLIAGDGGAVTELLAEDFAFRGVPGVDMRGRQAFCAYVQTVRSALDGYRCEILDCVTQGTKAFAKLRFSGAHVGLFRGFPPTGKPVHWVVAALFNTHTSLIDEMRVVGDFISSDATPQNSAPQTLGDK